MNAFEHYLKDTNLPIFFERINSGKRRLEITCCPGLPSLEEVAQADIVISCARIYLEQYLKILELFNANLNVWFCVQCSHDTIIVQSQKSLGVKHILDNTQDFTTICYLLIEEYLASQDISLGAGFNQIESDGIYIFCDTVGWGHEIMSKMVEQNYKEGLVLSRRETKDDELIKYFIEFRPKFLLVTGEMEEEQKGSNFYIGDLVNALMKIKNPEQIIVVSGRKESDETYYLKLPFKLEELINKFN